MKTTVSVIIPYYHGSRFLHQLLQMMEDNAESLKSEHDAALEVLLVNDSPDEIIKVSDDGHFSLKMLTNPHNCGIHASRVNGLKEASGEFVLFLDQDDYIIKRALASQLQKIGDADFVVGNGYDGEAGGGKHLIFGNTARQRAATDLRCHYYYNNLIRSPGQVLIRKASIPAFWEENILQNNGSDDAFLWILMLCRGCRAEINEEPLYEHVVTGENASGNHVAMLKSQLEITEKLNGIASPFGMRMFRRRAEYYCTTGPAHKLQYLDVGISRLLYAKVHMKA